PGLAISFEGERFHAPQGLEALAFLEEASLDNCRPIFSTSIMLEDVSVTVAALGQTSDASARRTWVNGTRTRQHGSHRLVFSDAFRRVRLKPWVILLHVLMHGPRFSAPTRGSLEAPHVRKLIAKGCFPLLKRFCCEFRIGLGAKIGMAA